jgi:phosphatidylserine/phosphatidylglycerophosphate/cardiolipin synthase-like enzyme
MRVVSIFCLLMGFPFEVKATSYPMTQGNKIVVLADPYVAAESKIALIREAQHHIHILMYYWDNSPYGKRLAAEVRQAVDRGVEVRIIINKASNLFFDPFEEIGHMLTKPGPEGLKAEVIYFNASKLPGSGPTDCLHEKMFVIDGKKAIVGGRNISDEYFTWKDFDLLVDGPVVGSMQEHFRRSYEFALGVEGLDGTLPQSKDYFPDIPGYPDGIPARVLTNEPLFKKYDVYRGKIQGNYGDDVMAALLASEYKVLRLSSYFMILPDTLILHLTEQAKSGKRISIMTNGLQSAGLLNIAVKTTFQDMKRLSESGASIFLWKKSPTYHYFHAKSAVLDEDHVILGSHNFTVGSMESCNEISLEFFSKEIGAYLAQEFDMQCSENAEGLDLGKIEKEISRNPLLKHGESSFKRILRLFI